MTGAAPPRIGSAGARYALQVHTYSVTTSSCLGSGNKHFLTILPAKPVCNKLAEHCKSKLVLTLFCCVFLIYFYDPKCVY